MPEPADDKELIAAWRGGSESAAAELVRRHARAVAGYLGAAGAGDDLDDLVQETFFKAFDRIETFRGESAFRTWLIRIASNALTDLRRKVARRRIVPLDDHEPAAEDGNPHEAAVTRDATAAVERELTRLSPMQRDVFLLRAREGASYEEIARALGTTPGSARVHYHNAVKRLKEVLR